MIFGRGSRATPGSPAGPEVTHFKRPSKITITTTTEKSLTKLNGVRRIEDKPRTQTRSVRQQATCGYIGPKALLLGWAGSVVSGTPAYKYLISDL